MRFLLAIVLMMASVALLVLDMTTPPHAQATIAPAPNCVSAVPSPVSGTPAPAPTVPGTLFINEVLTTPNTAWNCADLSPSTKDAWIELYNSQNQPVALSSSSLIINAPQENNPPFEIPSNTVIAPHGFLVVFPLGSFLPGLTITSVQLIIGNAQTAIDSVSIPTLPPDQSYARIPDGCPSNVCSPDKSNWQISSYPTPGASNSLTPPPPTPKPTKAPITRIPRPKPPKAERSSSKSDTTTSSNDNNANDSLTNDGIQPSWRTLQLPNGTASPSLTQVTGMPSSTTPQQQAGDPSDLPKKIIISVSVVVLASALFWCWKHFLSP